MKNTRTDTLLRAGIGLLLVALIVAIYAGIHERIVIAGDNAPGFTIKADNGRTVTLPNFGGKILVLNFGPPGALPACRKRLRSAASPPNTPPRVWSCSV